MISEAVSALRFLTRPFRRQFWLPKPAICRDDVPKVVLFVVDKLESGETARLERLLSAHQHWSLSDDQLPQLPTIEHTEPDTLTLTLFRVLYFARTALRALRCQHKSRISLSTLLCEADDMARFMHHAAQGRSFIAITSVRLEPERSLKRIKRFLSGLEHARYELWVLDRERCTIALPSTLTLPPVPLSSREIGELARDRALLEAKPTRCEARPKAPGVLRIMSYNIHSGIGLDGRHSVQRIAEVIKAYEPDFVALQEVDANCKRSAGVHHIEALQALWPSSGEYFPLLNKNGGQYGLGFLCQLPVLESEHQHLPKVGQLLPQEQRGLLKVRFEFEGRVIELLNTHLGLTKRERLEQLKPLLQGDESTPQILTGDLNCAPQSAEYAQLCARYRPTQERPSRTWFATFPLRCLDYCFVKGELEVVASFVPRNSLTRAASDHLPLITDLRWSKSQHSR